MTPIQQLMLGVGAKKSTYIDDVFSTFLYEGTGSAQSINNGIDLSGEGGLVWTKVRNQSWNNSLLDTVRGGSKILRSNLSNAESDYSGMITSFNNNGYTLGSDASTGTVNYSSSENYASWSFRKAPGFCDIIEFSGTGSAQTINHNLGCIPGLILIKRTDDSANWSVYHRDLGNTKRLILNETDAANTATTLWDSTSPTATTFRVGPWSDHNASGSTNIAYLFAGGESTAATARSVDFDGSDDYLSIGTSSDFTLSTNDFTVEAFFKSTASTNSEIGNYSSIITMGLPFQLYWHDKRFRCWVQDGSSYVINGSDGNFETGANSAPTNTWHHVAVTRTGNTFRLFLNGILKATATNSVSIPNPSDPTGIGRFNPNSNLYAIGQISNLRFVNGTALYTSSFRPPTEPLTNITNTKLLCCNNSSTTGSTVTPGTITANGSPTASSDSPFDDPAGFVFGESGSENVIKCGSYVGTGSAGLEVNLGWEPQWVMIKNASTAKSWQLLDSIRGIVTGGMEAEMQADQSSAEHTGADRIDLTSTGFKVKTTSPIYNGDGDTYIFMCLRRSDGYVGKPPELGTDVFNVIAADTTPPAFNANFAVDYAIYKTKNQSADWFTTSRLTAHKNLKTNATDAEVDGGGSSWFAYNDGFSASNGFSSNRIGWLWKRHAGFDVVAYEGDEVSTNDRVIRHSLGKIPEMIWVKNRTINYSWDVYHKGMNGGTNPWNYGMHLNETGAESADSSVWNNTAPTSLGFTVGSSHTVNRDGSNFIAMLFASVDGISKVGSFVGSDSDQTITTGFQPRFVIIKQTSGSFASWYVLDTTRGWGSGNDNWLLLNENQAQSSNNVGAPTSTGFTVTGNFGGINDAGFSCIYYAHA
tara:strand:- start:35 stop:2641 length:2607 start_codon:yes stop_codon:yes gene_type:complete